MKADPFVARLRFDRIDVSLSFFIVSVGALSTGSVAFGSAGWTLR